MIVVNSAEAKSFLENKALELRSALLRLTCDNWCASNETICKRYEALKARMASSPDTTEELDELRRFFDASKNELEELEADISASTELYQVFQRAGSTSPRPSTNSTGRSLAGPRSSRPWYSKER